MTSLESDSTAPTASAEKPLSLARRIEQQYRNLATGFMFAVFGIGAVILAAFLYPVSRLFAGKGRSPDLTAQYGIACGFALFVSLGRWLGLWHRRTSGVERLRPPGTLIVANHPTLVDVIFLLSLLPQGDCVVKQAAWRNPALWGIVSAAGYISNEGGEELIDACVERLQAGRTVLFFPEGSRSPRQGLRSFKRGAAHVAVRSGARVVPVFIDCQPPALKKGQPWYRMPPDRLMFSLEVGEPFFAADWSEESDSPNSAARRVNERLRAMFESKLDDSGLDESRVENGIA